MKHTTHILLAEDERDLSDMLAYSLRKSGYSVTQIHSGALVLSAVAQKLPDLILLDVMLPGLSGAQIIAALRANPTTAHLPVIMITARGSENDQLAGFSLGADDFMPKPFSPKLLLARIEALLRRVGPAQPSTPNAPTDAGQFTLGGVEIDTKSYEVLVDGEAVKFTLTEYRLLVTLVQHAGQVLGRAALMSRAMGFGVTVTERTIDVHITAIRRKLGPYHGLVQTIRGVGYRAEAKTKA